MDLATIWFALVAVLWIGYFVLDGFDLGVGVLLPVIGRTETERRVVINTIGPVWDGNEVWLLTAGGATFAAFPLWYATMFSGYYLALFVILLALIVRGVAFEYRGKRDSAKWRANWDKMIVIGSALPALLLGVAFGNVTGGSKIAPIDGNGAAILTAAGAPTDAGTFNYVGSFFDLLTPYALVMGLMLEFVVITHGAIFIALKTDGEIRARARGVATKVGVVAAVFAVASLLWAQVYSGRVAVTLPIVLVAAVLWLAALGMNMKGREGWAFGLSSVTIALAVVALFVGMYPNVMVSSIDQAFNLTVSNASSQSYTLTVMTIVALVMTPIVLVYQGWTYWVFRKRLSTKMIPELTTAA